MRPVLRRAMLRPAVLALFAATALSSTVAIGAPVPPSAPSPAAQTLFGVKSDVASGKILITLPAPGADTAVPLLPAS